MSPPLQDIRVIEVASYVSGPFAGLALADLGAEVIKVEPPSGDPYRRFGPQDESGGVMFRAVNRNKVSQVIDLKSATGVSALHSLLDSSDVLITNWRPRVASGFGLTASSVQQRWPRLVWIRVSGYGQHGPMAQSPAFDSVIQARTGTVAAVDVERPFLLPMYLADKVTAMIAAQAALAGLVQRSSTGRGSAVDLAMLDALAYFNVPDISAGNQAVDRSDRRVARQLAAPRPLATKDGAVVVNPVTGKQLKRALGAAGLEDRVARLKAAPDATTSAEIFYAEMAERFGRETTEYWLQRFSEADVPVTSVLTVDDHFEDPQVVHNQMYRIVETSSEGPVRRPRYPALFDGKPVATTDLPPPPMAGG